METSINISKEQIQAVANIIKTVADLIREFGQVPNGELYAHLMPYMSLDRYIQIIDLLKRAEFVREANNCLMWIGEKK